MYGKPVNPVSVVALITDENGLPLNNVTVTAVNKSTGQKIPVQVTNGLVSFLGEPDKEYDNRISAEGFEPVSTTLAIPPDANKVDEISIVMSKPSTSEVVLSMTAHVFKKG